MQQCHPALIDSEDNPIDQDEKAQIVLNARQRLMEWEAEQHMREKFQQARELALGHSGTDSQEACCTHCAEHGHRVRTRYTAHLAAMRDDPEDTE